MDSYHDPSVILQLNNQLKPNSNYSLMIRVLLKEPVDTHCYHGPWSEWSEVQTLTTKAVANPILLYALIPIGVIVLVMFAFCGYRALVRYTKHWNERIPNPNKSAIIKGLQKTKDRLVMRYLTLQNGSYLPYGEHLYVEPYNNAMMWTSSDSKDSRHAYQNVEHISRLDSDLISEEDTDCSIICDLKEDYPTATVVDGYKPFTDVADEQESEDIKDPQFVFSAFDGPYLFSESNLS
ncbi:PREDICTED: uncharacterized protein LOC108803180 isoform X2 [Nanorana parkeri]|uniref:uncharacterized protein LOC108803180 isoform X2 n=1 Tax=Nanorana parkeri TaxID=125878 RepID=UPI000854F83A|nr:PREDICTED: uncharacterized protein LOC108803180 isoform X2 [Nanorana parkeri]